MVAVLQAWRTLGQCRARTRIGEMVFRVMTSVESATLGGVGHGVVAVAVVVVVVGFEGAEG